MVSDKEILDAYKLLASKEGVFVEPASAASVAGLLKLAKKDFFSRATPACRRGRHDAQRRTQIVCILTGHGLKDPDRAIKTIRYPRVIKADLKAVLGEIGY